MIIMKMRKWSSMVHGASVNYPRINLRKHIFYFKFYPHFIDSGAAYFVYPYF